MNPDGWTVLLGYEPTRNVFAGYDLLRHSKFTSGSPSVQVSVTTLNQALQNGLSIETKANGETVIGIRNDLLLFYSRNSSEFHRFGGDSSSLDVVIRATELKNITSEELTPLSQERRRVIRETSRWSRSTNFRRQVLNAYENRCAITRQQLRLVDAAHILPVAVGRESIDDVRNGIALSPTYHRAFDNGLIYLDEDMVMQLNNSVTEELQTLGLIAGISEFKSTLGRVHLPFSPSQRPDRRFIQLANEHRGIGHP